MIARVAPEEEPTVEPSLAQRLAEELVVDLVRRRFDVVGLLELERDVHEALTGMPSMVDAAGKPTPTAMLAGALVDQAFRRVESEWRESRALSLRADCPCCALEQVERQARKRKESAS